MGRGDLTWGVGGGGGVWHSGNTVSVGEDIFLHRSIIDSIKITLYYMIFSINPFPVSHHHTSPAHSVHCCKQALERGP